MTFSLVLAANAIGVVAYREPDQERLTVETPAEVSLSSGDGSESTGAIVPVGALPSSAPAEPASRVVTAETPLSPPGAETAQVSQPPVVPQTDPNVPSAADSAALEQLLREEAARQQAAEARAAQLATQPSAQPAVTVRPSRQSRAS